jgi:hypothetical protein
LHQSNTVGTHKHRHPLFSFSCPHTLKHAMFSGKKPCSQRCWGVAVFMRTYGTVGTHKHRHPLFSFSCPHTLKHAMFSGKKPCSQGVGGWRCLCVHTVSFSAGNHRVCE